MQATTMFCTQCGTKLDDNARFCMSCGKPVADEPSVQPEVTHTTAYEPVAENGAASFGPTRRLRRISAQKKLGGVCAGFAEYFDMDVTLMRVIWLALLLLPPYIGGIAYIVCLFVLPKN